MKFPLDKPLKTGLPWGFRVASLKACGRGHMARCLALANYLPEGVIFYLDDPVLWQTEMNTRALLVDPEKESNNAAAMISAYNKGHIGAFLFDGYSFSPDLIATSAKMGFCVEILDFPRDISADVVLAPSLNEDMVDANYKDRFLVGFSYALLGEKFKRAQEKISTAAIPKIAKSLLISFGAFDSPDATSQILRAIAPVSNNLDITVLLGSNAPHLSDIRSIVASHNTMHLIIDEEDMIKIYLNFDMAVGSSGVSMLERMCIGIPSIIITTSENQLTQAQQADSSGAVQYIGHLSALDHNTIREKIIDLAGNAERRHKMRENGIRLIDGKGAKRAAKELAIMRENFESPK